MTDNQTPERKQLAGELKDLYDAAPGTDSTVYTAAGVRRPIMASELFANIGATIERTETFEIVADPPSPLGWCYRDRPGAKARYVVIAEADPDASILATIRKSLDVSDPDEADEMARQVLAGLRAAGLVSRS